MSPSSAKEEDDVNIGVKMKERTTEEFIFAGISGPCDANNFLRDSKIKKGASANFVKRIGLKKKIKQKF